MKECQKFNGLNERIDSLSKLIVEDMGNNIVAFLDTSAIIGFENEIKEKWKKKEKNTALTANSFYGLFSEKKIPLYVTDSILGEVRMHAKNCLINGSPEISDETYRRVLMMNKSYKTFISNRKIVENVADFEEIRRDVYWASKLSFDGNHKKSCIDSMSVNDRDLVARAIEARYSYFEWSYLEKRIDITGCIILSLDEHIRCTLDFLQKNLKDENKASKYNGIKSVKTE